MKKLTALLLALTLTLTMAGCGDKNNKDSASDSKAVTEEKVENAADTPLELLNGIWETYAEDEKFPAAGGDFSEENSNMEGPGKYALTDAEAFDVAFGLPADSVKKLEDAASLMHMMNANTFTACAMRVSTDYNVSAVAGETKTNLDERQWVCGAPEELMIYIIGNDIIVSFGAKDLVDQFQKKLTDKYPSASLHTLEEITIAEDGDFTEMAPL